MKKIGLIVNLKSNMDRFIVTPSVPFLKAGSNLKSNMDRFIAKSIDKRTFTIY